MNISLWNETNRIFKGDKPAFLQNQANQKLVNLTNGKLEPANTK